MVELLAAVSGAAISAAFMGFFGGLKRNDQDRMAIVRLTLAVEHIAEQLSVMHIDMKESQREVFARLNSVEQRVTATENRI